MGGPHRAPWQPPSGSMAAPIGLHGSPLLLGAPSGLGGQLPQAPHS